MRLQNVPENKDKLYMQIYTGQSVKSESLP